MTTKNGRMTVYKEKEILYLPVGTRAEITSAAEHFGMQRGEWLRHIMRQVLKARQDGQEYASVHLA